MARWTPQFGSGPGLTPNEIGRQASGVMQPSIQQLDAQPWRAKFRQDTVQNGRPYANVGKMSMNFSDMAGQSGENVNNAGGLVTGLGAGVGRWLGGFVGQGQAGADIGEAIGRVGQAPLDLAAGALGAIPAIPILPGGSIPGMSLMSMSEEERTRAMAGWDRNPLSLLRYMNDLEKQDWTKKIENGEVSTLFRDLGPASSLGDQIMNTMGLLGLPSNVVQRMWAGGPGDATSRILNTDDKDLNPEVASLKAQFKEGTLSKDQFLDELVLNNAGYTNEWGSNLLLSMVADPLLLLSSGAGLAAKSAIGAKMLKAGEFTKLIKPEEFTLLSEAVQKRAVAEGVDLAKTGVTQKMILEEAEKQGIHSDAIAEASRQMKAKDRWLADYAEPLTPIFNAAQAIADPISQIGKRGSKPMMNAWLTKEATIGVANAYGRHNFRAVQGALQKLGKRDLFDEAMGYYTAQEGKFMQGDLLAQDVAETRGVSMARPNDIAEARLRVGSESYGKRIETAVGQKKVDMTRPTGLDTAEASLARAKSETRIKIMKIADITEAEADEVIKNLDADGLSMIDAAYYGHKIKRYNLAMKSARGVLAGRIEAAAAKSRPGEKATALEKATEGMTILNRVTLIGRRELTRLRADALRKSLDDLPTAEAAEEGRKAIRRYDRLGSGLIADGPTDEEIVTSVRQWLDDYDEHLTHELTDAQKANLPDELLNDLDPEDGYIYGMRPEGDGEWRIKSNPDTNDIVSANPWMDIVGDAAQPWNSRFSGNGRISTMLDAVDQAVGAMSHQITTDKIFNEARRDFINKAIGGYMPSQKSALTYDMANDLWKSVLDRATELKTTPRGMTLDEFEDVIAKHYDAKLAGISGRDLMGMTLHSFEGRLSTVGVTQKATGKIKTIGMELTGGNYIGSMAERIYPAVRFAYNPFFQLQEWIEPWIFSAARGKQARLTGGWLDPITGTHVDATEVMRLQQHLIDRYRAGNPYAHFDMMERSNVYLHGAKSARDAAAKISPNRLDKAREMARGIKTTHDRKMVAQSEMFRYFLGPMLHDQFNNINPGAWAELEMHFGTTDEGTIALRWLLEKDVWAATDPKIAYHLTDAVKSRVTGRYAPIDLDATATHTFGTTRDALTLQVKDGTLTLDDFMGKMREIGADDEWASTTWKALQFDAKEGGLDNFWKQATEGPGARPQIEVDYARALVQHMAASKGISEIEFVSRTMNGNILTLMQDDLVTALDTDLFGWDALFQQAKYAQSNWFTTTDPVTGLVEHTHLSPEDAEARFLSQAKNPPSDMPLDQHGAYDDMQKLTFGEGGRDLYIPGGQAALDDLEKPWTVWEAHLIRNQLVDPRELLDPAMKHALYEKMWRAHVIDMADPENGFRVFNNTVMAMLSAGLNLTRNELVSTRFRVNSLQDLERLAADAGELRATIAAVMPPGYEVTANDLGLAYSTRQDVAHYIPLDSVNSYERAAYLPKAGESIRERASVAAGYLDNADRSFHTKTMRAMAQRDAVAQIEAKADNAIKAAQKKVDEAVGDEAKAVAQKSLDEATEARKAIDPKKALAEVEARDAEIIDSMDLDEIAKLEKRSEKAAGRISEWAVDQAIDAIARDGMDGLRTLPASFKVPGKTITTVAEHDRYLQAVGRLRELRGKGEFSLEDRDLIRELVPGAQQVDQSIIWKPWNVNGAGLPHAVAPGPNGGRIVGHGDHDIFAYIKNDDVAWRGFSTNAGMGNSLAMAEDMVGKNKGHYIRRRGPQYARSHDPFDFNERMTELYERHDGGEMTDEAYRAALVAEVEARGVTTGHRWAPYGADHWASRAVTGESARAMGIPGYAVEETLNDSGRTAADGYLRGIADSTGSDMALFSGQRVEGTRTLPQVGQTLDLPITSTTPEHSMAEGFSRSMDYTNKTPGFVYQFEPGTRATAHSSDEFLTAGRFEVVSVDDVPFDEYNRMAKMPGSVAHPDAPTVKVVKLRQKEVFEPNTNSFQPVAQAEDALEPLDEFAERMSHRTRGLSLKTGYFGVDLGDPIAFERGVMDTHMVGELTEFMYYELTNKGKDPRWNEWLQTLSPAKRNQIDGWLKRDYIEKDVIDPVTKKPTGAKIRTPHPEGAPRGAGNYDWSEATGKSFSLKPSAKDKVLLDAGDSSARAAFVRNKIAKSTLAPEEQQRLLRMYRTEDELAELYDRNIKVLGGDYRIYDDLMEEKMAAERLLDPTLNRHGHGGYQWKLWDDRRAVFDPEASVFAAAHTMPKKSVRYMAASDDLHYASGFMDKGGLRSVADAGYRFLDPVPTVMAQRDGSVLRGATIFHDQADKIIAITENANASTLVHELAHALLEPMLDPSGKQVVIDDMTAAIRKANAELIEKGDAAKVRLADLTDQVTQAEAAHLTATTQLDASKTAHAAAVSTADAAEKRAQKLTDDLLTQEGRLKQMRLDEPGLRRGLEARKLPPSKKRAQVKSLYDKIGNQQERVDLLRTQRDEVESTIESLWDDARAAKQQVDDLTENVRIIGDNLSETKKAGVAAKQEYDDLVTTPPKAEKFVWDEEVSEHFAEQYTVWLRTGKASSPKLRDAFAYFHAMLEKLEDWVKGNPQAKVSQPMQDLFDSLHTPAAQEQLLHANRVPFDATDEMFHAAARESVVSAEDAAFTNVQFRRGRSWAERSLNHPYFGLYPFSYMWGKVVPEMGRSLALNPFGFPIPGMLEGASPGLGFVNAQRAWNAVEMQKDTDPEFNKFVTDPLNDKMFRAIAQFVPATPWDAPANFPLWTRRLAEWGLESQDRAAVGKKPKGFDPLAVASEVAGYTFGPSATLDWASDIARIPKAPAITQFTGGGEEEDNGVGGVMHQDLFLPDTPPIQQQLGGAGSQLNSVFGGGTPPTP